MTNTVPDNEQHRLNLISEHSASVSKFTYFMMSAAGAGLGFAITQAVPSEASRAMSMLFLAMMAWSFSFYAGIREVMCSHAIVAIAVKAEEARLTHSRLSPAPIKQFKSLADKWADKTQAWTMWQIRAFLVGAVSMALWRLWEVLDEISK